MNRVWVVAGYEREPDSEARSDLIKRASEMIQQMFPESGITVETESGSWWLIVTVACATGGAWLLDVLARWGVTKILDHAVGRGVDDSEEPKSLPDEKLNQCIEIAHELQSGAPPISVLNIAEYNDDRGEGVLLQVTLYEQTEAMNIVKFRNIEDLPRLMRPR